MTLPTLPAESRRGRGRGEEGRINEEERGKESVRRQEKERGNVGEGEEEECKREGKAVNR